MEGLQPEARQSGLQIVSDKPPPGAGSTVPEIFGFCRSEKGGSIILFREMRRCHQQLEQQECIALLKKEPRGVLSVLGDGGYPYGMPLDHWYCEEDGILYFHCAKEGHKLDAIRRCDRVSYCVYNEGFRNEGEWALNILSVIVFGRIHPVEDPEKAAVVCRNLCRKFTDDEEYIDEMLQKHCSRVLCLALTPEHMTGKRVKES